RREPPGPPGLPAVKRPCASCPLLPAPSAMRSRLLGHAEALDRELGERADLTGPQETFVPALPVDLSWGDIAAAGYHTAGLVAPARGSTRLGTGCAGSAPAARLVPRDTPAIGRRFELTLFSLPANVAVLLTGFSTTTSSFGPLPLALAQLG